MNTDINKILFQHIVRFLGEINKPHLIFEDENRIHDIFGTTMLVLDDLPRYYLNSSSGLIFVNLGDPKCIEDIKEALRNYN